MKVLSTLCSRTIGATYCRYGLGLSLAYRVVPFYAIFWLSKKNLADHAVRVAYRASRRISSTGRARWESQFVLLAFSTKTRLKSRITLST